jgi:hypothetical protein
MNQFSGEKQTATTGCKDENGTGRKMESQIYNSKNNIKENEESPFGLGTTNQGSSEQLLYGPRTSFWSTSKFERGSGLS